MNRAVESVFAEYQRDLLEEFEIFALDGGYESGSYSEEHVLDRLSYYGASGMEQEILRIQFLTDGNGQAFLEQAARFMESRYGLGSLNHLLGSMNRWEEQEEAAGRLQQTEENQAELPEEDNPLPNIRQLAATPLTELAMPKEKKISEKAVEESGMVSHRSLRTGRGDFSDVADKPELSGIAFGEYVLTHFSSAADAGNSGGSEALDYEVEYILEGKSSDRENLEAVLKRLAVLRFVPNYTYLQGDAAKRAEAKALALTLCTVAALPAAAEALT